LDCHAYENAISSGHFERVNDSEEPWRLLAWIADMIEFIIELGSNGILLWNNLLGNREMAIYALVCISGVILQPIRGYHELFTTSEVWALLTYPGIYVCLAWAATTSHGGYITSEGIENVINHKEYRRDVVANGLQDPLLNRM
jgi:hypothetical protein